MPTPPSAARSWRKIPAGRPGRPEDWSVPSLFLCSDAAAYVTGIDIPVDGGWTHRRRAGRAAGEAA